MPLFQHRPLLIVAEQYHGTPESAMRLLALYPGELYYDATNARLYLDCDPVPAKAWIVTTTAGERVILSDTTLRYEYQSL